MRPVSDIPLPSEYVVGPGDRLEVQLIGNTKSRQSLVVNRDGRIMFPELGPIVVAGLKFDAAKARIEARVSEQMIGTQAIVSMSDLRSIRIFVLGEAERPGSYTVSGLSTITNALFASGGVKKIGSLRNIQLKRGGTLVTRLDLYDLLLNGDTSNDVRLLPGDVIFIPPVGDTVGVAGAIRRPAIYELRGESTASDLLYLGGGLMPDADPKLATIERIDESRERIVLDVDLSSAQARGTDLRSGDVMRIPAARPTLANSVQLKGHVQRPSSFQYRSGMRLTDVIPSVDDLKPNADARYVMIRREAAGEPAYLRHFGQSRGGLALPHERREPAARSRATRSSCSMSNPDGRNTSTPCCRSSSCSPAVSSHRRSSASPGACVPRANFRSNRG